MSIAKKQSFYTIATAIKGTGMHLRNISLGLALTTRFITRYGQVATSVISGEFYRSQISKCWISKGARTRYQTPLRVSPLKIDNTCNYP